MMIAGIILYSLIGIITGFVSIFIWGSINQWLASKCPAWLIVLLIVLTAVAWPAFILFCVIWNKINGPFKIGWLKN